MEGSQNFTVRPRAEILNHGCGAVLASWQDLGMSLFPKRSADDKRTAARSTKDLAKIIAKRGVPGPVGRS